jgi:hypothetical protein
VNPHLICSDCAEPRHTHATPCRRGWHGSDGTFLRCACKEYRVLVDSDAYDSDEGREWITVNAGSALDAEDRVRRSHPRMAVLRAEEAA